MKPHQQFIAKRRAHRSSDSRTIDDGQSELEIWLTAWLAVARSSNCANISSPGKWADQCVFEYRARMKKAPEEL